MRHEHHYDDARRQAENDLEEINRHLKDKKITSDPRKHHMLIDARDKTISALKTLDDREITRPYRHTGIGYNADMRRDDTYDARETVRMAMDTINRILPRLDDDMDDDDMDVVDMPRWRSGRTGRFLPNLYGRGRVRRVRRRADIDDRYDDIYPSTPVMPHNDRYADRHEPRLDDDVRPSHADRTRNIGPGTTRE